jgi:TolA-binding protein
MSDSKITALIAIAAFIFGIIVGKSFSGKTEDQEIKDMLQKTALENTQLKDKISTLNEQLSQSEVQAEAGEKFRMVIDNQNLRIHELENSNQNLKSILNQVATLTEPQDSKRPVQLESDNKADVVEAAEAEPSPVLKAIENKQPLH